MKLIININDSMVCNDIQNKALKPQTETDKVIIDALYNGIPYEEQPALNDISESDKQKLIETIRKSRLQVIDTSDGWKWIPVTYRPMTEEEEKEFCVKWDIKEGSLEDWEKRVFTCPLPDDGQEILISTRWGVSEDVCSWDDDSIGLEDRGYWDGVDAWMPKPEPYKKEGDSNDDK